MKGALDGGLDIPHNEKRFFGYDGESKKYDPKKHRERIMGKHVADYMTNMKKEDEEAYKRHFSKYIAAGVNPDGLEKMYKGAHTAIRANPDVAPKKEKKVEKKRWTRKKKSLAERKARVKQIKENMKKTLDLEALNKPAEIEEAMEEDGDDE